MNRLKENDKGNLRENSNKLLAIISGNSIVIDRKEFDYK